MALPVTTVPGDLGHHTLHNDTNAAVNALAIVIQPGDDIQAAIDAAPAYSTLHLMAGIHTFTRLTVTKSLIFRGDGFYTNFSSAHNDAIWTDTSIYKGTTLVTTVADGVAVDIDSTFATVFFEHLGFANAAAANTSIGIDINTMNSPAWNDVHFCNFETGLKMTEVYYGHFAALEFKGCATGWQTTSGGANTITAINVVGCDNGVAWKSGVCVFNGGAIQGCFNIGMELQATGEENVLSGIYFENTPANYALVIRALSDANMILNCHFGDVNDAILVESNGNYIILPKYVAGSVSVSGDQNVIQQPPHITITDTGSGNILLTPENSGLHYRTGNPVLTSPNGTEYQVTVANDGTLSTSAV